MTKKHLLLIFAIALFGTGIIVFPAFGASNHSNNGVTAQVDARIKNVLNTWQNDWKARLTLKNTLNNATSVTGDARVKIMRGSAYDVTLKLRAENLPNKPDMVFEGWLVDTEGNYKLSMGAFNPGNRNTASLTFSQRMINPAIYDTLVITAEPVNDRNPAPSEVIFSADLKAAGLPKISLRANLSSRQEVPATESRANGTGKFIINTETNTVTYHITFRGLSTTETGAHIHGPARAGANAAVLHTLPMGSDIKGEWKYEESMENKILDGHTYVNIHSEKFPNGEIRGQIVF